MNRIYPQLLHELSHFLCTSVCQTGLLTTGPLHLWADGLSHRQRRPGQPLRADLLLGRNVSQMAEGERRTLHNACRNSARRVPLSVRRWDNGGSFTEMEGLDTYGRRY